MTTHTINDWLQVGLLLYGKIEGNAFTQIVRLISEMPLCEGMAIIYSSDLTFKLGTPLGRV